MRVLLTTWGSRGDVEPMVGLAVALRGLGAEVRVCAPPDDDFVQLLGRVGVPLVPLGPTVRSVVANPKPPTAKDALRLAPELVAARFDTLGEAARGCDAIVAGGLMPAGARDVAEHLGIRYVYACFHVFGLPSRHFAPGLRPGTPSTRDETDNRALWEQDAQRVNALYGEALNSHRAALRLPPVDNVRDHVFTGQPWLAADEILCPSQGMTDLDVVQTGAWVLPDDRPLPDGLDAFLAAGAPPVYVGFGSMAAHAPKDVARVAVEAVRAHGRRILLARGWAGLKATDDAEDCFVVGEVNQQALFGRVAAVVHHGGAGTTTTATRAGAPQIVVPQIADQPYWAARVAELGAGVAHEGGGTDGRVPVRRAHDRPGPRDPDTSQGRGRHDPGQRSTGGRETTPRRGQLRPAPPVIAKDRRWLQAHRLEGRPAGQRCAAARASRSTSAPAGRAGAVVKSSAPAA